MNTMMKYLLLHLFRSHHYGSSDRRIDTGICRLCADAPGSRDDSDMYHSICHNDRRSSPFDRNGQSSLTKMKKEG